MEPDYDFIPGPWDNEPDLVRFKYKGLWCAIIRSPGSGHLCGYVGLDEKHPWFGKDYGAHLAPKCKEEFCCEHTPCSIINVHGGLTYAGPLTFTRIGVKELKLPENLHWFGFDCAHCDDMCHFSVSMEEFSEVHGFSKRLGIYRDMQYVKEQCIRLADQLLEVNKDGK